MSNINRNGKGWFSDNVCSKCSEKDECASMGGLFLNMDKCIEVEKLRVLDAILQRLREC
jgi:hypothetical protein